MNCIETKNNIESLIDGELTGSLKSSIENHLLICRECCELKEEMILLSSVLHTHEITPSEELDERVMNSFRRRQTATIPAPVSFWQSIFSGSIAVPKPVFAALLLAAAGIFWTAFTIGKSNSTIVSVASPSIFTNELPVSRPVEPTIKTVVVEVPVVKEKIVTRTVYISEPKKEKAEKITLPNQEKTDVLPPSSSTVADNGYFTDVSLKGFEPPAEISAKIIKEEKKDEK